MGSLWIIVDHRGSCSASADHCPEGASLHARSGGNPNVDVIDPLKMTRNRNDWNDTMRDEKRPKAGPNSASPSLTLRASFRKS